MSRFSRRKFLEGVAVAGAAASGVPAGLLTDSAAESPQHENRGEAVDFRYAPRLRQATICFPDDANKTVVGGRGDLRYDFSRTLFVGVQDFGIVCTFSLAGMQDDRIARQWLEAPRIPIVHTRIERPTATLETVAFATRHAREGRVDNVLMTVRPKQQAVAAVPRIHIHSSLDFHLTSAGSTVLVEEASTKAPFLVARESIPRLPARPGGGRVGATRFICHLEKPRASVRYAT